MQDAQNPYQPPLPAAINNNRTPRLLLPRLATGSPIAFGFAVLPAIAMTALFYSLAVHMFLNLKAWPTSIGENGFPPSLVTHAWFAQAWFAGLSLICFAWPLALLISVALDRWNFLTKYLVAFAIACAANAIIMSLAPSPFLYWWWD